MTTEKISRAPNEGLGVDSDTADQKKSQGAVSVDRVSSEQIHTSACGSAIEINYDEEIRPTVIPFIPEWAFGSRLGARVLNLSIDGRGLVAYSSAHAVVLYDYKSHTQTLLLGHRNTVASMATDATGSWLVTVDSGPKLEPSSVILWNLTSASLERMLPCQVPDDGFRLVAMSADGQVAAAVAAGPRRLVFLWRCGSDLCSRPEAVAELPDALGTPNAIAFDRRDAGCFMVTCDKNVAFLACAGDALPLQLQAGQLVTKCPGNLVDSIYQRATTNVITVSTKGFVILWTDPPIYAPNAKVSRKVYCIDKDGLTAIAEVDGMVVIGTRRGHIRFYDPDMCLLHWYQQVKLDAITSLSFKLDSPGGDRGSEDLSWVGSRTSFPTVRRSEEAEQRGGGGGGVGVVGRKDLARLISGPTTRQLDRAATATATATATADTVPFQARDLIVSTASGRLVLVSFASQVCVELHDRQDVITVIQTHTSKSQLLIGRANGSVSLVDFAKKEVMVTHCFERQPGADPVAVTSLRYSPNGMVLACGLASGSLHLLHPVLLHPILAHPFRKTRHAVHRLCFSPDSMFMAHSDSGNFVSAYRCHDVARGRWVYLGKKLLHGLPLRHLLFGPQRHDAPLFSLAEDLVLVEYDVAHSPNNTLLVSRMDRIEQSGLPADVTWCPGEAEGDDPMLLIATSEFKYKLVDLETRRLCGTYQGPRLRTPVGIIKTIGGASAKSPATAVYATQCRLGLQGLPPNGNPFTDIAMMGHSVKIMNFVISACEEFVFSCGVQDHSILMWRINPEAVALIHAEKEKEQTGVQPWLLSVEGGRGGWLFRAMQDMFCYAQLQHQGALSTAARVIGDRLPLCELPDVLRAVGFFPSQFEIYTMVRELRRRCGEFVDSSDLLKLLVNYKPTFGVSLGQLREAFRAFAYSVDSRTAVAMTKDKFLSVLLDMGRGERGEALSLDEAHDVLRVLLEGAAGMDAEAEGQGRYSNLLMDEEARREKLFYFLPETITFDYLVETILGVAVKK